MERLHEVLISSMPYNFLNNVNFRSILLNYTANKPVAFDSRLLEEGNDETKYE
jgi:hypothetical protein